MLYTLKIYMTVHRPEDYKNSKKNVRKVLLDSISVPNEEIAKEVLAVWKMRNAFQLNLDCIESVLVMAPKIL